MGESGKRDAIRQGEIGRNGACLGEGVVVGGIVYRPSHPRPGIRSHVGVVRFCQLRMFTRMLTAKKKLPALAGIFASKFGCGGAQLPIPTFPAGRNLGKAADVIP